MDLLVSLALLALIFLLASASSSRLGASYREVRRSGRSGSLSLRDREGVLLPALTAGDGTSPEPAAAAAVSVLAASCKIDDNNENNCKGEITNAYNKVWEEKL